MSVIGRVLALHRYPVKSLSGEAVDRLDLDERGVVGDRRWSVRTTDGRIGSGKTTRRFRAVPGLLTLRAAHRDGEVVVTFPDGTTLPVGDPRTERLITRHVGQPVTLETETTVSHFDDGPVSLLGRSSVDDLAAARGVAIDPDRFRANILVDVGEAYAEDDWVGQQITVGDAVLRVTMRSPRCVMVDMATAGLPPQPGNLTALGRLREAQLGVVGTVVTPGRIRVGDVVRFGTSFPSP